MKNILKVVVIFLFLCGLLGYVVNFSQNTECELESLIVKDNMIPPNWERLWRVIPPVLPKDGAQDALEVDYENGIEIAHHTIYQYKNSLLAMLFLRINKEVFFPSGQRIWSELEGSDYWMLHGDEERIRCGDSDDPFLGFKCDAVIRYGAFISEFSSPIEEDIMSHEEFKEIVVAIDNQIAACIQSPNN